MFAPQMPDFLTKSKNSISAQETLTLRDVASQLNDWLVGRSVR